MAQTKLPPRQRMINMMYLVLTAMLALNVTAEVLNAFKTVDDGISRSNQSLQTKTANVFGAFETEMNLDAKKTAPFKQKAEQTKSICKTLYDQLEKYKQQVIKEAGGYDPKTGQLVSNDNIDIATRIFVDEQNGKKIKEAIQKSRDQLLALPADEDKNAFANSLPLIIDEPKDGLSWEFHKFNHVPTIAAITLLSKYQNDALAAENQLAEYFLKKIDFGKHKVDKLTALVNSPSSYIMQGLPYTASVMLTAYSSTQNPDVFLGAFTSQIKKSATGNYEEISATNELPPLINPVKVDVTAGLGKIQMQGNNIGESRYTGVVRVKDPSGSGYKFYPFEGQYQVAAKSAVVSPTNMNVLYAGLENPVSVSVPGVAQKDVTAAFDGPGLLEKKPDGSYVVKPSAKGNYKIKVTAKVGNAVLPMGEMLFRVKRVPQPLSTIDGIYESGNISAQKLKATNGIVPVLKDFLFAGVRYDVLSYKAVAILPDGDVLKYPCAGARYDAKFRDLLNKGKIKKGCNIVFEEIVAKDPSGEKVSLSPIAFVINNN